MCGPLSLIIFWIGPLSSSFLNQSFMLHFVCTRNLFNKLFLKKSTWHFSIDTTHKYVRFLFPSLYFNYQIQKPRNRVHNFSQQCLHLGAMFHVQEFKTVSNSSLVSHDEWAPVCCSSLMKQKLWFRQSWKVT